MDLTPEEIAILKELASKHKVVKEIESKENLKKAEIEAANKEYADKVDAIHKKYLPVVVEEVVVEEIPVKE